MPKEEDAGAFRANERARDEGLKLDYTRPRKPTDKWLIESFNGRLRDESLIEQVWQANLQVYGVRKVCRQLHPGRFIPTRLGGFTNPRSGYWRKVLMSRALIFTATNTKQACMVSGSGTSS